MRIAARGLMAAFLTLPLSACAGGSARLEVENRSPHEIHALVLSGRDFQAEVESLPAGTKRSVPLKLRRGGGVVARYTTQGRERKAGPLGYITPGATAQMVFGQDGKISMQEL